MSNLALATTLKNVTKPYEVGVNIRIRVLDRITHAGLRREVHDGIEAVLMEKPGHAGTVDDVQFCETEIRIRLAASQSGFLERHVIVVVQVVDAVHRVAALEQLRANAAPMKPATPVTSIFIAMRFVWARYRHAEHMFRTVTITSSPE